MRDEYEEELYEERYEDERPVDRMLESKRALERPCYGCDEDLLG